MSERRYSEREVAEIFERAAEAQHGAPRQVVQRDGMTLAALQEIGEQVGIPPEIVARAARSVDRPGAPPPPPRFLGLPLGVGRTIELGRKLTDDEWDHLVVDVREAFDARGTLRADGAFREWTNGNLHIMLEPSETGHRLRMRTVNGAARFWMNFGLAVAGVGIAVLFIGALGTGAEGPPWPVVSLVGLLGGGMFGVGAFRLPGWARRRTRQMDALAARAQELAERTPSEDDS